MVLPRSNALRAASTAGRLVRSVPRTAVRSRFQTVARRGYASGHGDHGHAAPSSDLPWLVSAVAVTLPSCYFLWPEASEHAAHGDAHGDAHEEHEEEAEEAPEEPKEEAEEPKEDAAPAEESKEEESKDEQPKDDQPKDEESKDDQPKDEQPKDDDSQQQDKPDKTEPEKSSNQKVDGVQFKGKTAAGDDNNEMTDNRKREPDSKGAYKKRIDSDYAKELGGGPAVNEDGKTNASASHPISDDSGSIDNKQKGLSTTMTKHSTAIHEDPEKSKKGEGSPETAKSMGTVDVNRPQK